VEYFQQRWAGSHRVDDAAFWINRDGVGAVDDGAGVFCYFSLEGETPDQGCQLN